jgi:CBS domain-containing protein
MRIRELVHGPAVTCPQTASLAEVARSMRLHDVGSVVVVDATGEVVGIVTDRDLALKGYGGFDGSLPSDAEVNRVMTHSVLTIGLDADIDEAAHKMAGFGVRRLAVLDQEGAIRGVVSLDDLVVFFEKEGDVLRRAFATVTDRSGAGWAGTWDM